MKTLTTKACYQYRSIGLKIALFFASFSLLHWVQAQPNTLTPKMISYIANTSLSVRDVHTDCKGNIVYVGGTGASAFTITPNTISTKYNGGNSDVFIVKVDSTGNPLWKTLLGGNLYDRAYAVEIDSKGFIYVAGRAGTGLPTTSCALQKQFAGDNNPNSAYGLQDGFITKITPDGSSIVWSTYIGCDGRGFIRDIDIDSKGNIWAGISNASPNFPYITNNAVQKTATATMNPALIKLSADGRNLLYGTFLSDGVASSAGPTTVRIDKKDNVYFLSHASANNIPVTANAFQSKVAGGVDFVISKFDSAGNLLFCSFLGGQGNEEVETHSLEIDTAGNVVVAAYTYGGTGYPIVGNAVKTTFGGVRDGVITKISSNGNAILASTYLGGNMVDEIQGIGIDVNDNIYVAGRTASTDFPVTVATAYQKTLGGANDGHLTVLSPNLSAILYCTYLGGTGNEDLRTCHVDEWGKVHSGGNTASTDHPILQAFNTTLTGTSTGTAVVLAPMVWFEPKNDCQITNAFVDPCLNTGLIKNASRENLVSLYPNPASDKVTITLNYALNQKAEKVQLYNSMGALVQEFEINAALTISITDLPEGLYIMHIENSAFEPIRFIKH